MQAANSHGRTGKAAQAERNDQFALTVLMWCNENCG